MKRLGALALVLFAASSFGMITSFPNGKFTGQGYWKDTKGTTGNYKVDLKIKDNKFEQKLVFDNGEVIEEKGAAAIDKNGFVTLTNERGETSGDGYCGSVWCHFELKDGMREKLTDAEETYAFVDGNIFRVGSAVYEGTKFFWEDALQAAE